MKCMFQNCPLEATKIVLCEMGMTREHIDAHVCKVHYDLLLNGTVNVSMEIKEDKE